MFRRDLGASKQALPDELQAIWDAIRRIRSSTSASILPEGFTWGETTDGNLVIIQNGAVVSIGGGSGDCDCVDGVDGVDGAPGPAGPVGPAGPAGTADLTVPQRVVSVNDSVLLTDRVILCEQVSPITLQLPVGAPDTTLFIFKDIDGASGSSSITISANGGDTIDGSATYTMDVDFMSLMVACDGAGRYFVI